MRYTIPMKTTELCRNSITYASPINDDAIRSIAPINVLKQFRLWNPVNNVSGVDWSPLENCESLESIDI